MIDRIKKIKEAANADIASFLRMLYDYDIPRPTSEWKMGNIHGQGGESLVIWANGTWKDFQSGEGGDLLDLARLHWDCSHATLFDRLELAMGLSSSFRSPHPIDTSDDLLETADIDESLENLNYRTLEFLNPPKPEVTPKPLVTQVSITGENELPPWLPSPDEDPWTSGKLKVFGSITNIWPYHTKEGFICFWVCRYDNRKGKAFSVAYWSAEGWINKKPKLESFPLLDIHYFWALRNTDTTTTIVLVEGEKAAVAANALRLSGFWFTTWHGGAKNTRGVDFMALKDRHIILWPDNDAPGKEAMKGIYTYLNGNAFMTILDIPKDWAIGDDVADIADRFDAQYIHSLLLSAMAKMPDSMKNDLPDEYREPNQLGSIYRLLHKYGSNLKYSVERGEWYVFKDGWWQHDKGSVNMHTYARSIVESVWEDCLSNDVKAVEMYAKGAKNHKHIMGIIEGASMFSQVSLSENDFDPSPDHIACVNGLLDLRTGEIVPLKREHLASKIIPIAYDPEAKCPMFMDFLNQILCSNVPVRSFLQDFFGYCLTGNPPDRIFPIFYGTGKNGKSTLMNIIQVIMGDYHVAVRPESIMASDKPDKIGEDIIPLRGARLASMQESERGGKINEAKIKALTGRDRLRCRYLHSNTWLEWTNTAKIVLSTNYKPRITGVDKGIWDRVALVGFDYRVRDSEEDSDLHLKILKNEASGILNWLVQGAMHYYKAGKKITRPGDIVANTNTYHMEENVIGSFIDETLQFHPNLKIGSNELYIMYKRWMDSRADGSVLSNRNFTEMATAFLKDLSAPKKRESAGWFYCGVGRKENWEQNTFSRRAAEDEGVEY